MRLRRSELRHWTATRVGRVGVAIAVILGIGGTAALQIGGLGAPSAAASTAVTPTIWVINQNANTLLSYPLSATGNATPGVTISSDGSSLNGPFGTEAFDASGDLWIANLGGTLVEYTPSQLASTGSPTPNVTISSDGSSLSEPGSVAFDRSGDLWALNEGGALDEYTPSQLASSGSPTPAVTISGFVNPYGLAFDGSGDLWVTDISANTVVEYTPSQLVSSGSPTPAVTISANASSIDSPSGVAFDASGNLWVTNTGSNTLVEFTPSQLGASGDPTPAVTVSATGSSLDGPYSLAFDAAGNLWVPNAHGESLVEYTASQLAATGNPTPVNTIIGAGTGMSGPGGVVIEQAPTVTSVVPNAGPAAGGTMVTIQGTGFNYGSTVDFGSTAATSVTYESPWELTAVSPAGSGVADVTVSTFAGTSATSPADQFTYASSGYTLVGSDGGTFALGTAPFLGSLPGDAVHVSNVVGIAPAPSGNGNWLVGADGGVFAFGSAIYQGSIPGDGVHVKNIVGIAPAPSGNGYWLVGADGGVFAFGSAVYQGSLPGVGVHVSNIVGIVPAPSGNGYWLVGSDGGIFAFGSAVYRGSLPADGVHVKNIVGVAPVSSGNGYLLVGSDGGTFAFGSAVYQGSLPGVGVHVSNIVGIAPAPSGNGYWLVGSDGGIFSFGSATYQGSLPGDGVHASNIVGIKPG
jgi:sugar lactone lactonase YvrE